VRPNFKPTQNKEILNRMVNNHSLNLIYP
jgi:hypothetical protein